MSNLDDVTQVLSLPKKKEDLIDFVKRKTLRIYEHEYALHIDVMSKELREFEEALLNEERAELSWAQHRLSQIFRLESLLR